MPKKMDNILAQLRRNSIEEMVSEKGSVTVTELCEKFNVTSATIRSDLTKLESAGRLERTYGGAVCVGEKVYDPASTCGRSCIYWKSRLLRTRLFRVSVPTM